MKFTSTADPEPAPSEAPSSPGFKSLADRQPAVIAGWTVLAVSFISFWEWAGRSSKTNTIFFSYPTAIWQALVDGIKGDLITLDAKYTVAAAVLGFSAAAIAGIGAAFVLSQTPYLYKVLRPVITALNSLPRVALAPLFIMWFGIGLLSHVIIAASLSFFVLFASTMAGIESVDQDHLLLARLQGATRWQTFQKFIVPSALPSIFVGLELGFIFGMLGTVA